MEIGRFDGKFALVETWDEEYLQLLAKNQGATLTPDEMQVVLYQARGASESVLQYIMSLIIDEEIREVLKRRI